MNAPLQSTSVRLVLGLAIVAVLAGLALRPAPVVPAVISAPVETEAQAVIDPTGDPAPAPDGPACDPPRGPLACTWTYNDATGKAGSLTLALNYQPPTKPLPYPMTWRSRPFTLPADYCGVRHLGAPETVPRGIACTVTFERLGPERYNHVISVGTAELTLPYLVYRIGPDLAQCEPLLISLKSQTGNGRDSNPKGFDFFQISEPSRPTKLIGMTVPAVSHADGGQH